MSVFGSSTPAGGGTDTPSSNWIWVKASTTPAANGTLTNVHAWCARTGAGGNIAGAIYSDSAGAPGALLAANNTGVAIPAVAGDAAIPLSVAITAGTQYWLAIQTNALGGDANVDFGASPGTELFFKSSSGNFPATGAAPDGSDAVERWTVWGEYTPAGGSPVPVNLMGQACL